VFIQYLRQRVIGAPEISSDGFLPYQPAIRAAFAQGIADRVWSIGDLLDAAPATQPIDPVVTAPDRRRTFGVIEGGR
jgi:hypothetical protein